MSWCPMVQTVGDPRFYTNALRYATEAEALADAANLMLRWTAVTDFKAEERPDPVNRRWEEGIGSVAVMSGGAWVTGKEVNDRE
jgi:hypothetical protein